MLTHDDGTSVPFAVRGQTPLATRRALSNNLNGTPLATTRGTRAKQWLGNLRNGFAWQRNAALAREC